MIWSGVLPRALLDAWRRTGLTGRLGVGVAAIILFTLAWDQLAGAMDAAVRWPVTGLVAAVGWARVGILMRPMFVLFLLGLAFDSVSHAPFGVFPLVFLGTYALLASAGLMLGGEMDPLTGSVLPYLGLAAGFVMLWLFASVIVADLVDPLPLIFAWLTSSALYFLFEGLFDLDSFKASARGG